MYSPLAVAEMSLFSSVKFLIWKVGLFLRLQLASTINFWKLKLAAEKTLGTDKLELGELIFIKPPFGLNSTVPVRFWKPGSQSLSLLSLGT